MVVQVCFLHRNFFSSCCWAKPAIAADATVQKAVADCAKTAAAVHVQTYFQEFCGQFACILQALYRVFESILQIICRQFARSSDISQVDSNKNFAMD